MDEKLKTRIAENSNIIEGDFERELFSSDAGEVPFAKTLFETTPELVIMPENVEVIKRVLQFANEEKVAIFLRGAGSSGLGGVVPTVKGIVLDLSLLNNIIEFNREKAMLKVQSGIRWSEIESFLETEKHSIRTYPSSFFSTVGGWIATGGYGMGSFRFGHLKDQIESIEVMLPSGEIKNVCADAELFPRFFSTEGQFGIVLSATLKLRAKPEKSHPHLVYFESCEDAFEFIRDLVRADIKPETIKYLDASHLAEANSFLGEALFKARDAVLVEIEEEAEETKFLDFSKHRGTHAEEFLANYIWHERFFPMKRREGKPTPLACELVISLEKALPYLNEVKRISKRCGIDIQAESYIVGKDRTLLLLTHLCDVRELATYMLHLNFIPVLTALGIKYGGVPYGVGIWNSPFIEHRFDEKTLKTYREYKKEIDPANILNPNKFFSIKTKLANIPGVMLRPLTFSLLTRISSLSAPVLARLVKDNGKKPGDESVLKRIAYSCLKCGSCAATCPAYLVTREQALIPKNKLYLARKLLSGGKISKSDSDRAFLCMHCELCREVCQNDLDLEAAWAELEKMLESRFGRPEKAIKDFISTVEASDEYWRFAYAQKISH